MKDTTMDQSTTTPSPGELEPVDLASSPRTC